MGESRQDPEIKHCLRLHVADLLLNVACEITSYTTNIELTTVLNPRKCFVMRMERTRDTTCHQDRSGLKLFVVGAL